MPEPATDSPEPELLFNPFAPGFAENPYEQYGRLRAVDPVHHHPLGFWVLTRYDDVNAMVRADLSVEERNAAPSPMTEIFAAAGLDGRPAALNGLMMLDRDPPDHTRLRRLVAKAFTPRSIAALEPRITELVAAALNRIETAGEADLVAELAFPLPFSVIAEMLGTPSVDHDRMRELTGILVRSVEPVVDPAMLGQIQEAERELVEIVTEMIAWKRVHPADDIFTRLLTAEDDGDVLTPDELVAQLLLLYVAGHETTVNLIANGALALLRDPEQWALLRANPALAGNAVEELLRYDSPVQMSRRITRTSYDVGGVEIPAGAFVFASLAAANRDERMFGEDAGSLRLDRDNARHQLAFGGGQHHCLGAALARLEGRVAIGQLVARFEAIDLTADVTWNGRVNLRGPAALPIRVR